jgi:hypothetical protein
MDPGHEICPGCHQEMDPEVCWCGIERKDHNAFYQGHSFVPTGCECGRSPRLEEKTTK